MSLNIAAGTHMRLTSECIHAKIHVLLCACKLQPLNASGSTTIMERSNASDNLSRVHLRIRAHCNFHMCVELIDACTEHCQGTAEIAVDKVCLGQTCYLLMFHSVQVCYSTFKYRSRNRRNRFML